MSAKRFAHYSLEGLLRQGPHEVWVTLGRYTTVEQAEEVVRKRAAREGIVATRVLPCYRQTPEGAAERGTGFTVA
jgi:hypothetical protein